MKEENWMDILSVLQWVFHTELRDIEKNDFFFILQLQPGAIGKKSQQG